MTDLFLNRLNPRAHPDFESLQGLRVSSHFYIRRRGGLRQYVEAERRAWHAGVSEFKGRQGCNDFSIGVELEGSSDVAFTEAQYSKLAALTLHLSQAYPLRYVAGHSDIAPLRKSDPGPHFDWPRYLRDIASTGLARPF